MGQQELALLRFIEANAPVTARELVEGFAAPRNLARSTVLTMAERLRQKGHVSRARRKGVFHYRPKQGMGEALQGLLRRLVEGTFEGSVSPLIAYLAEEGNYTDAERERYRTLIEQARAAEETAEEEP